MKRVEFMYLDLSPVTPKVGDTQEQLEEKIRALLLIDDLTENGIDPEAKRVCIKYDIPVPREVRFIQPIEINRSSWRNNE
jgi:hypothetical protein